MPAMACGFDPRHRHQTKIIRTGSSLWKMGSDYLFYLTGLQLIYAGVCYIHTLFATYSFFDIICVIILFKLFFIKMNLSVFISVYISETGFNHL